MPAWVHGSPLIGSLWFVLCHWELSTPGGQGTNQPLCLHVLSVLTKKSGSRDGHRLVLLYELNPHSEVKEASSWS